MSVDSPVAIVADEHALSGAGLIHIMETCLKTSKLFTCRNYRELSGILGQYQSCVSLAVVHYNLPGMGQAKGLRRLCETWPSVRILVSADSYDRDAILEMLSAGCHGFIAKSSSAQELAQAITEISKGHVFVSPASIDHASADASARQAPATEGRLTVRQKEVLDKLAEGKSNKQIALVLGISEGTVKAHVNAAFRVLGVHNRVNATMALLSRM